MSSRRFPLPFPFFLVLLACLLLFGAAGFARAEEPEILKGTVKSLEGGVLYLKDVSFEDETLPRRDIKVAVDKDTAFYHGIKKVPKEEITPDCRVLVRCSQGGPERKALLIRIIGGKAQ